MGISLGASSHCIILWQKLTLSTIQFSSRHRLRQCCNFSNQSHHIVSNVIAVAFTQLPLGVIQALLTAETSAAQQACLDNHKTASEVTGCCPKSWPRFWQTCTAKQHICNQQSLMGSANFSAAAGSGVSGMLCAVPGPCMPLGLTYRKQNWWQGLPVHLLLLVFLEPVWPQLHHLPGCW